MSKESGQLAPDIDVRSDEMLKRTLIKGQCCKYDSMTYSQGIRSRLRHTELGGPLRTDPLPEDPRWAPV